MPLYAVYDADQDGWDPVAFHAAVDRRGPGIVLGTARNGQRFGGYNSKGWAGVGEYRSGLSNFLYAWDGDESFLKVPKVGGAGMGVVDMPDKGCLFGAEGLSMPFIVENPRVARCKLGPYYARTPAGANSIFTGGAGAVELSSLRVYVGDWQGEPIPFDDAMPFSLT
jgi:hypothetical protein